MKISYPEGLISIDETFKFAFYGKDKNAILWQDDRPQPSEDEVFAKIAELEVSKPMRLLRLERDRRLAETDWWALSDLTITDEQKDYRQKLRDITEKYTSLEDVVWPEKPE